MWGILCATAGIIAFCLAVAGLTLLLDRADRYESYDDEAGYG